MYKCKLIKKHCSHHDLAEIC